MRRRKVTMTDTSQYDALPTDTIDPRQVIGGARASGTGQVFHAVSPWTGEALEPAFTAGSSADIDAAAQEAAQAFASYRHTHPVDRAVLLETIAEELEADRPTLVARAHAESALPLARLEGELRRATGQLRFFADILRDGWPFDVRVDTGSTGPTPRPDLRLMQVPLGPVVVFGASNFPFAFSNAGGDTAAALAAGCPVIVKCHEAHPGTAVLVSQAVQRAVAKTRMPEGVYSALLSPAHEFGAELVAHPNVSAVGFTGSRTGGLALMKVAAARPRPIPFFAEMSSVNPVVILGDGANAQTAQGFVASFTLGAGQFCTNPGLLFVLDDARGKEFVSAAAVGVAEQVGQTMLTPGIARAFSAGVERMLARHGVTERASGTPGESEFAPAPRLFETTAGAFQADPTMQEEIFGAAALVVRCTDTADILACLAHLEGQLTATLHVTAAEHDAAREILPALELLAGRLIVNGWPTGVEVAEPMTHGGPFPATSDGRSTSVGALAINRFLRQVTWQSFPAELLPAQLTDDNPWTLPRRFVCRETA